MYAIAWTLDGESWSPDHVVEEPPHWGSTRTLCGLVTPAEPLDEMVISEGQGDPGCPTCQSERRRLDDEMVQEQMLDAGVCPSCGHALDWDECPRCEWERSDGPLTVDREATRDLF